MTKFCFVLFFLWPLFTIGQRQLKPSVHLRPFEELDNATVTALEEDDLGQIWIGTQTGIRFWDGNELHKVDSVGSTVTYLYARDSCMYGVLLQSIIKINCWTLETKKIDFAYSDYRHCNFLNNGIFAISSDYKDTIFLDYDLVEKPFEGTVMSLEEIAFLGQNKVFIDRQDKQGGIIGKDSTPISNTFISHLVQYDSNTVFVATHEGLVELQLNKKRSIDRLVHLKAYRVEQLLLDRYHNLWVGTAENGLFLFHRTTILNKYYPQYINEKEYNPCWTFVKINGLMYSCTTNGMVAFENMNDELSGLEKATKGMFCFTALETPEAIFIGSAREGLYTYANGVLKRIYYNPDNYLDNTIVQILPQEKGVIFCTKTGIHKIDVNGKLQLSKSHSEATKNAYVMRMYRRGNHYLAANTSGLCVYDESFNLIRKYKSSVARVFADLAIYRNKWWCVSMDGGIFTFENDTLIPIPSPKHQLLMTSQFNDDLWFTGLSGAMQYRDGVFTPFELENGFPLSEYAQGGLFNDGDSLLHFGGVQGVFTYKVNREGSNSILPQWHIKCNDHFLPPWSELSLAYDQSIVSLLPRAIITSDRNWFELDYHDGHLWVPLENSIPLLVKVDYGSTELKFRIRHKYSGEERVQSYFFNRGIPIWLKTWFRVLVAFVILTLLTGIYFLWKYFRTKKMLKIEAEERKITQERLRISRELHDNIGARLSHIISSLDIQLFKEKDKSEISVINAFAKDTMRQLRETIWAVGDKTIFFSELKQRTEQYITQTNAISPTNIEFIDDSQVDFELNATETINLFRIMQEAINNAIKYSNAEKILVRFYDLERFVHLTIRDNGIGFSVNNAKHLGTGIKGMVNRAEEINAEINIDSHTGKGTVIKLIFPFK